jgi:hypothetical protein
MTSQDVRDILTMVPGLEIAEEDFGEGEDIMDMALPNCRCPRCAQRRVDECDPRHKITPFSRSQRGELAFDMASTCREKACTVEDG